MRINTKIQRSHRRFSWNRCCSNFKPFPSSLPERGEETEKKTMTLNQKKKVSLERAYQWTRITESLFNNLSLWFLFHSQWRVKRGFQSKDEVSIDKAWFLTEGVKIREKDEEFQNGETLRLLFHLWTAQFHSGRVVRKEEINDEENNSFYCRKSIALRLCLW